METVTLVSKLDEITPYRVKGNAASFSPRKLLSAIFNNRNIFKTLW